MEVEELYIELIGLETLPNSKFARISQSVKRLNKYGDALYLGDWLFGWLVSCNAGLTLMLLWPLKMLSHLTFL